MFIQEREVITGEREIHGLFLFGSEVDLLEASQGSGGRGGGADDHAVAAAGADVVVDVAVVGDVDVGHQEVVVPPASPGNRPTPAR